MAIERTAAVAANRFGLGPLPGELEVIGSRPTEWLLEQLESDRTPPPQFDGFMTASEIWANLVYRYTRDIPIKARQRAAKERGDQQSYDALATKAHDILYGWVTWCKETYVLEVGARSNVALTTRTPFLERLVHFWSNHLVVPNAKQTTQVLLGAYEREVIRPHVTGKFADMLMAAVKHQAMLAFLDNHESIGPNSEFGRASGNGLNENLAREILELHTLGVDGGYTQRDVIELAKGITGWSILPTSLDQELQGTLLADAANTAGQFQFYPSWHEPGERTLLGKVYAQSGIGQGEAMLRDLARHPSTARFLATKLARHFVADAPPESLIDRLADVYLSSDTDLGEMARALVEAEAPWESYGSKLKQPVDYVYSALRTLGITLADNAIPPQIQYVFEEYPYRQSLWVWYYTDSFGLVEDREALRQSLRSKRQLAGFETMHMLLAMASMGQPLQVAPGPQGWYDRWSDWNGPDSLMKRVEWATSLARTEAGRVDDVRTFATSALGDEASEELRLAVARAATPEQGLALVLASPEFQRR